MTRYQQRFARKHLLRSTHRRCSRFLTPGHTSVRYGAILRYRKWGIYGYSSE
jgi:hypothetical protein